MLKEIWAECFLYFQKVLRARSEFIHFIICCLKVTKNGGVSSKVVKVVHDDRHKEIEHEEAAKEDWFSFLKCFFLLYHMQIKLPAQEDKGDEEDIGQLVPAKLQR